MNDENIKMAWQEPQIWSGEASTDTAGAFTETTTDFGGLDGS